MSNLDRFIERAESLGASLLYAPKDSSVPLASQGSVEATGILEGDAELVTPGLIAGAAALEMDGTGDYVATQWKPLTLAATKTFIFVGRRASTVDVDYVFSTGPGEEDVFCGFNAEGDFHFTANGFSTTSTWELNNSLGTQTFFGALTWKAGTSVHLYMTQLDGELTDWGSVANTGTPGLSREFIIGDDGFGSFNGQILPFAAFSKELTRANIEELRRACAGTFPRVSVTSESPATQHHIIVRDPKTGSAIARWAEDEPHKENVLNGVHASGALPGGKKELNASLPRDPRREFPDLEGFLEIELNIGARNRIWHGRIGKAPRSDGEQMVIDGEAVGYAAALEDRKALRIGLLNSELGKWGEPSTARRLALYEAGIKLVASTSIGQHSKDPEAIAPAVINDFSNVETLASATEGGEAHFEGGEVDIWKVMYDFLDLTSSEENVNWSDSIALSKSDSSYTEAYGVISGTDHHKKPANQQSVEATSEGYKHARIADRFIAASEGTDLTRIFAWKNIRVLGWLAQSLALQGEWPNVGFTAAQMLRLLVPEFSELEATEDSIEDDGFIIQQAWWSDPGTLSRVVDELVKYGLYDWFVKDAKLLELRAPGTYGRNWQAYQGPSNFQEAGTDTERLWDRIVVAFSDPDGSTRYVGYPGSGCEEEYESLQITDPNHPAVRAGVVREDLLVIQSVTTGTRAKEVGERFLANANELPKSGKAELSGFVQDDKGVFRPVGEVAEGDLLSFRDARDSSYRKIVNYDYDADARKVLVDLDAPSDSFQALLERFDAVLQPMRG